MPSIGKTAGARYKGWSAQYLCDKGCLLCEGGLSILVRSLDCDRVDHYGSRRDCLELCLGLALILGTGGGINWLFLDA